jgi:hypothetical protein
VALTIAGSLSWVGSRRACLDDVASGGAVTIVRIGITGHQKLPAEHIAWIADQIRGVLVRAPGAVGVTSLAKGADQLFAHCVLDAGHALEAVLPCREYAHAFELTDLDDYYALLERAQQVVTLDFGPPSEDAFLAAGQFIASHVDGLIAVWDGGPAQGRGGTGDIVTYARSLSIPVTVVWPPGAGTHDIHS